MILIVCVDDLTIGKTAFKTAFGPEGWDKVHTKSDMTSEHVPLFWNAKEMLGKMTINGTTVNAMLGKTEDLIVTAHGNKSEMGNEGSGNDDYNIGAYDLATKIANLVLPSGYGGNIYLSACKSCHFGIKFKEMLLYFRPNFAGKLFGYKDSPSSTVNILDVNNYDQI